ncbi:MAG: UvrD-helicase domain-containing protein [Chlamydiae bacterium]|nr:UvrD-helicase domain-containing protein [Chlamydiota bacterium]
MIVEDLLKDLNPSQKEAVEHTGGPLLILAGAGSGKTRVITYRIAYLIGLGVDPHRILAVTFTNKAAEEMRTRVGKLVSSANGLWIGTFHSTCVRILRRQIDRLGYRNDFVIYDDQDQIYLVKECLKRLNLSDKEFRPQAILGRISNAKNELMSPEVYREQVSDFFDQKAVEVYQLYQKLLKTNNALDFDDLILNTVQLFLKYEDVLKYYQDQFQYLMIDEYQDTNHAQYRLVNLLARAHQNICVVGDPDQAIYRWRGADFRNLLNFEDDYPKGTQIVLDENYRSTQNILNASNHLIRFNTHRKEKNLWTEQGEGEKLCYYNGADEREEVDFVINGVERLKRDGRSYQEMVVFYRTHAQSRVFEDGLRRAGIPYQIIGGVSFYQRKEIKDMVAYLRLIEGVGDSVSFERVVNVPQRGIGDTTLEKVDKWRLAQGVSPLEAARRADEVDGLSTRTRQSLKSFYELIAELKAVKDNLAIPDLVNRLVEKVGYFDELRRTDQLLSEARIENVKEFISFAEEYVLDFESPSLGDFLQGIALVSNVDQWQDTNEKLTLMTLHSAKGLEFPIVFIVGLEEGICPHSNSSMEDEDLEEERRLLYVGMTRAKERLVLSSVSSRLIYGRRTSAMPSRFLREIPSEYMERMGLYGHDSFDVEESFRPPMLEKSLSYQLGQRVLHAVFGMGEILEVEGEGDDMKVRIMFEKNSSPKWLMAKYARLTPL